MNAKKFLDLYNINKIGLSNENKRLCLCGTELSLDDKECPNCKEKITKGKLLNVNKNSALGKRYESTFENDKYSFRYYQLLSNGFELYETLMIEFTIDTKTCNVVISNSKIFKRLDTNKEFIKSLEDNLSGFTEFVYKSLGEFNHDYAISKFTSLSESQLRNFVCVYFKYRALIPFLRGYKVFYYGDKVNLDKYYPNTDFNDIEAVKATGLNLMLLLSWDIKNQKYIESIIEISNNETQENQLILSDIIKNLLLDKRKSETYENTINVFSLLYNKEISINDFIRIYNNSRDNYFNELFEYRKLHKKLISKTIDWSNVEKIDRKLIGTLKTKEILRNGKVSKSEIEDIYELVNKNPLEALKALR